jgi:hypothetical protein
MLDMRYLTMILTRRCLNRIDAADLGDTTLVYRPENTKRDDTQYTIALEYNTNMKARYSTLDGT